MYNETDVNNLIDLVCDALPWIEIVEEMWPDKTPDLAKEITKALETLGCPG